MGASVIRGLVLGVLLLAGCATAPATNVVTFDRTKFAVNYGKLSVHLTEACSAKGGKTPMLDTATCTLLRGSGKQIEEALYTEPAKAPASIDMTTIMELVGVFVGAAK